MKLNKKQLFKMISDKNKIFSALLILVIISITGLMFLGKGTYSVDEEVDKLIITCPEAAKKGEQMECSLVLNSVTMNTYGVSVKYNVSSGLVFNELVSDSWKVTTSDETGFVIVNLDGVRGTDNLVGTVKYTVPTDAVDNYVYKVELTDITIGDGEETVLELENSFGEIRVKSDINTLDDITLSTGVLNETFDKSLNNYTANIDSNKITINVSTTDERATVAGDGEVNIHYGTNNIDIIVTSESGIVNTYKISIYRDYIFSSDIYKYSEKDKYIYTGTDIDNNVILNNIILDEGLSRKIENNKLIISYESEVLKEYNLINVSSSLYDLGKEYIYTGTSEMDSSKINVVNGDKEISGNKVLIKYGSEVIEEIDVFSVGFGNLRLIDKLIVLDSVLDYDSFVSYISITEGINYKILKDNDEITSGNIDAGMMLEIYYNDIKLDSYEIFIYSMSFNSNTTVDNENKYVKYLTIGTTVGDFIKNSLTTIAITYVYDSKNNIKENNEIIKTGDVLKVVVGDTVMEEYMLSVLGDSSGDGRFSIIDVAQLRKYLVKWKNDTTGAIFEMKGVYKDAFDFNKDGKISIVDLAIMRKKLVGLI